MSPCSWRKGSAGDRSALPLDGHGRAGGQPVFGQDRRILAAGRRCEAIAEFGVQRCRRRLVEIDVDPLPALEEQRAQIIDPVGMVGMLVGVEHAVEPLDFGIEKLLAQIRRSVDQDTRRTAAVRARRSTRSEVRRRRFFGLFGSQSPQPSAGRGTPPEEPQPRIVKRMVNFSVISGFFGVTRRPQPVAALLRTGERNSRLFAWRSRRTKRRVSRPRLLRFRPQKPARCACREIFRARDRAHRSRPGCGPPAIPPRSPAAPANS